MRVPRRCRTFAEHRCDTAHVSRITANHHRVHGRGLRRLANERDDAARATPAPRVIGRVHVFSSRTKNGSRFRRDPFSRRSGVQTSVQFFTFFRKCTFPTLQSVTVKLQYDLWGLTDGVYVPRMPFLTS
ncbi:hypothetical protein AMAG_18307 [Allomyces macrogynus ATCC 38327]|uniref:Uncharacterized protein n=1 Tax=Allomyces macrogynus (strain ATCC 38327) TaxID=578462 RepID=A0A0L0S867_ALLM3|nr:hypothetical protein AMAG_18307 [Allomyces macrogynus ATCC 38327]|eukprot:KNE58798.1 hypothetical protein AMAG_18307 [Allomyces macrogynus ATCC 38327]